MIFQKRSESRKNAILYSADGKLVRKFLKHQNIGIRDLSAGSFLLKCGKAEGFATRVILKK